MSVKIEIKNVDGVIKDLDKKKAEILGELDGRMHKAVLLLEGEIKETAPVRTGRYRAAWHASKLGRLQYEIRNNVFYAKFLIFGTRKMSVKHDVVGILKRFKRKLKSLLTSAF